MLSGEYQTWLLICRSVVNRVFSLTVDDPSVVNLTDTDDELLTKFVAKAHENVS